MDITPTLPRDYRPQFIWLLLLCYVSGIIIMSFLAPPVQHGVLKYLWLSVLASVCTLAVSCYTPRIKPQCALLILAVALGANGYIAELQPPSKATSLNRFCDNSAVNIKATVLRIDPQPKGWRMDVAIQQIEHHHSHFQVQGRLRAKILAPSNTATSVAKEQLHILPGDNIIFSAKLRRPRPFNIPGEFNYAQDLARFAIFYTALIHDSASIGCLSNESSSIANAFFERWRTQLGRKAAAMFPANESAYLLSLTLGQKTRLSTTQRNRLSTAGISHLFSISGLHLALLAGLIYKIFNWFYRRSERLLLLYPAQNASIIAILPFVYFYLFLSGTALPTLRAALLISVGALALLYNRHTPTLHLLALVALSILICSPLALFSASFQLSFAGVGAIILCLPTVEKHCSSKLCRWTILPLFTTIVATLATAPIALWHFHTIAPAGILCNLFAIPIIGIITVPLALTGTMLLQLSPTIAFPILKLSVICINTTLLMTDRITTGFLAGQYIYLSPLQHLLIATICFTVLACIATKWRIAAATTVICALLGLVLLWPTVPAPLEFTAFSVGQGDSFLLRLADKKNYLIDGGGFYSKTFDVGQRLLAPALGHEGINHLDAVILSHDHPDHRKGLIYILQHFAVDQFWCSIPLEQLHFSIKQVIRQRHIPVRLFPPGWTIVPTGAEAQLDVFVPPDSTACMNDRSLVVLAHYRHDGVLLTGDLEKHGIAQLLAQPLPATINLLKLPHHGSRRSSPNILLTATHAHIAIASVGFHNHYGFPHTEVINALQRHGATLFRTDRDGSIRFSSSGNGWGTTAL